MRANYVNVIHLYTHWCYLFYSHSVYVYLLMNVTYSLNLESVALVVENTIRCSGMLPSVLILSFIVCLFNHVAKVCFSFNRLYTNLF